MANLKVDYEWLDKLMPEGLLVPSSTIISGPGGTGKPLVGFAFVSSWLNAGGNVILAPLQYPSIVFTKETMEKIYKVDSEQYAGKISFVHFEPSIPSIEKEGNDTIKANLLNPEAWDKIISMAEGSFGKSELGTLVFSAAVNLLLFSKTYADIILEKLKEMIEKDKSRTYIFTVSTSVFEQKIHVLEDAADNFMVTRMVKPMNLYFRILRMKKVQFSSEEVLAPFSEKLLKEVKRLAESQREKIIPTVSRM